MKKNYLNSMHSLFLHFQELYLNSIWYKSHWLVWKTSIILQYIEYISLKFILIHKWTSFYFYLTIFIYLEIRWEKERSALLSPPETSVSQMAASCNPSSSTIIFLHANARERQWRVPPTHWEDLVRHLTPDINLDQLWLMHSLGKWTNGLKNCLFLPLPLSLHHWF